MLAKNYHYSYEAIYSTKDVIKLNNGRAGYTLLCRGDVYYPLYNVDQVVEGIAQIKKKIKEEIESEKKVTKKEEVIGYMVQRWNTLIQNFFSETTLKVIIETGYKEELKWSSEEKLFEFNIGNVVRVQGNKQTPIPVDEIVIKDTTYKITTLPESISKVCFQLK